MTLRMYFDVFCRMYELFLHFGDICEFFGIGGYVLVFSRYFRGISWYFRGGEPLVFTTFVTPGMKTWTRGYRKMVYTHLINIIIEFGPLT